MTTTGEAVDAISPDDLTLNAWIDRWLVDVELSVRPRTVDFYRQKLAHFRPLIGDLPLREVKGDRIRAALQEMTVRGMSASMLHHCFTSLRTALNGALADEVIARNPCSSVRTPRRSDFEATTLTTAQARRLVMLAWNHRLGPLLAVALHTGMREGELLALTWADVDLEVGRITVDKTVRWPRGAATVATVGPAKTRRSRRTVLVDGLARDALLEQRHRVAARRLRTGAALDLVFPSQSGSYWSPSGRFKAEFQRLLVVAQCPRIRFHDLRHTAGLFYTREVGDAVASRILGHSSPAITNQFYGAAQDQDFEVASKGMSDVLGGEGTARNPIMRPAELSAQTHA